MGAVQMIGRLWQSWWPSALLQLTWGVIFFDLRLAYVLLTTEKRRSVMFRDTNRHWRLATSFPRRSMPNQSQGGAPTAAASCAGSSAADDPAAVASPIMGAAANRAGTEHPDRHSAAVRTRSCQRYIPEKDIHTIYRYPLRIRAEDSYPIHIVRSSGEDVSILSEENREITSDP